MRGGWIALAALFATACRAASPLDRTGGEVARPLVIAHRGASAYLPQHTLGAYALACAQGADFVEPDVVATKDGALVCLHDVQLDLATNASFVFPGRARDDGHWYACDFTLEEVRRLRVLDRTERVTDQVVPTLDDCIGLVQGLEDAVGKTIGVMPELKEPAFHAAEGLPLEAALLTVLADHGYTRGTDAAIVQCFDLDALQRLRADHATDLWLVWLLEEPPTGAELDRAARWVDGLGPEKSLLFDDPALVEAARARGLPLFPWTFEGDEEEMERAFGVPGVAGLFANDPDVAIRARARWEGLIE